MKKRYKQNVLDETDIFDTGDVKVITDVYPTEAAWNTRHLLGGNHDDDTLQFSFVMQPPESEIEEDDRTIYTFNDGVVLIREGQTLFTEQEWRQEKR